MKKIKTISVLMVAFVLALLVTGCGDGGRKATPRGAWKPTMVNPAVPEITVSSTEKGVPDLEPNDIVVAVNGAVLTRADIDESLRKVKWALDQNVKMQPRDKANGYKIFGKTLIKDWIQRQVVVWESRRLGCTTEAAIREQVGKGVERMCTMARMTPETFDKRVPGGLDGLRRELEESVWVTAYMTNHVKSEVVVDDAMVARIKGSVVAENEEIAKSNALAVARLKKIREEAIAPGADFGAIADKYSEDEQLVRDGTGYWGDFTPGMIPDQEMREKLFTVGIGQISDIIEDGDYYMIVKMLNNKPGKLEPGEDEASISLARVALERQQPVVFADEAGIKRDLERQYLGKAQKKRVDDLMANAKIVYPYGQDFWNTKKRNAERESKSTARQEELRQYRERKAKLAAAATNCVNGSVNANVARKTTQKEVSK